MRRNVERRRRLFFSPRALGAALRRVGESGQALHLEGFTGEQGPLDLFAWFQPDRRRKGQRHIDIQPWIAPLGADRLHCYRVLNEKK